MLIAPEDPGSDTLRVPVLNVFDGDGFLTRIALPSSGVERELTVRFGFIDAPEMAQPGGREAKDFLEGLIGGRSLHLAILLKMDTGGVVDRHGRIVAVPYLRQEWSECDQTVPVLRRLFGKAIFRNVELEMVLNGWAWVLDRYGPDQCYFDALKDAQLHRRGIWAREGNIHPWEFKKQKYRERRRQSHGTPQPNLFSSVGKDERCPTKGCGGRLVKRSGRFGTFYGCSDYPNCRYSRSER